MSEPSEPASPDLAMRDKLATGVEELAEAIAEQLRTQAQTVRNESETAQPMKPMKRDEVEGLGSYVASRHDRAALNQAPE